MRRVDILAEASARDPELEDAEPQRHAGHADNDGWDVTAPARSVRRATARRASNRRATARSHQDDSETRIIAFVAQHPGSTAGALAKGLNLDPADVSTHLTQLAQVGEVKKTAHGYSTEQAPRPRGPQRPPHHAH
jgi:hypothetical protein